MNRSENPDKTPSQSHNDADSTSAEDAKKSEANQPTALPPDDDVTNSQGALGNNSTPEENAAPEIDSPLRIAPFVLAGVVVIAAIAILVWWLVLREPPLEASTNYVRDSEPANGVILDQAPPSEWIAGDCLRGFSREDDLAEVTIIQCDWEYDAQVLHWENLEAEGEDYPGDDTVEEKTIAACEASQDSLERTAIDGYAPLEVVVSYPTEDHWNNGDRRVNCLLARGDGEKMQGSFVKEASLLSSEGSDENAPEPPSENTDEETDD